MGRPFSNPYLKYLPARSNPELGDGTMLKLLPIASPRPRQYELNSGTWEAAQNDEPGKIAAREQRCLLLSSSQVFNSADREIPIVLDAFLLSSYHVGARVPIPYHRSCNHQLCQLRIQVFSFWFRSLASYDNDTNKPICSVLGFCWRRLSDHDPR